MRELELFDTNSIIYKKFLPIVTKLEETPISMNVWDIPYTIKSLSYLVHSHYRYYGKFPSVVAGQLLEMFPAPSKDHYVLDNFCGSGTTLVEARLRGIKSFGLDISWLSCLASNVKVKPIDVAIVLKALTKLLNSYMENKKSLVFEPTLFTEKWFSNDVAADLNALQKALVDTPKSEIRDFLLVAFLGIIRRVSKAHDAEVRPHINKKKRQRDVIEAFVKKVKEMSDNHKEFMAYLDFEQTSECFLGNNLNLPNQFNDEKCYLVISHPPYLNSFNYTPVFSLEFYWGEPFEKDYGQKNLHKKELIAHPAIDENIEGYFSHLQKCYEETFRIQPKDAYLAIVIGDCTRNGELINVLERTVKIVESIGYKTYQINNRTTHYGLGKYAYKHRANYHGDSEKKEGILIFRK
ncbi:hypothetical protein MCETALH18_00113 [Methylophilaceae bacterium]